MSLAPQWLQPLSCAYHWLGSGSLICVNFNWTLEASVLKTGVHKFDEVYRGPSAAINTRAPVGANYDQQQQHWNYFDSQPGVESICKRPPNLSRKHISVLIFKKWKPPTEPPAFLPSKFGRQDHPFTNWWCIGTTRKVTHLGFPDRGEGFKGDLCVFSTEAMPSRCFPQFAIHFPPMTQCHLTNTENLLLVPF